MLRGAIAAALVAGGLIVPTPSEAVVYCTRAGFPAGCVVRPAVRARVATPGVGAPGVGVAPGVGAPGPGVSAVNRGGPVNRVGVR
jgi:hypothetical protein